MIQPKRDPYSKKEAWYIVLQNPYNPKFESVVINGSREDIVRRKAEKQLDNWKNKDYSLKEESNREEVYVEDDLPF